MRAQNHGGASATVLPTASSLPRAPLPAALARDLRGVLCRSLAEAGWGVNHIGQILGINRCTVHRHLGPDKDDEDESASLPSEVPPGFEPPRPRPPVGFVSMSEAFIAGLRRDYGKGRSTDDGRALGDDPEVAAWLATLKPRKAKPTSERSS